MKSIIKSTFFIAVSCFVIVNSEAIIKDITSAYNNSIHFMASNTVDKSLVAGF